MHILFLTIELSELKGEGRIQIHTGRSKINMSCFVRKPVFCICENKGGDQLHHDPEDRFSHDMAHIINHEKEHNTKIILLI